MCFFCAGGNIFSLVHPLTEGEPLEGSASVQWSPPPGTQSLTSSRNLSNQGDVKHTCEFSNLFTVASSVASGPREIAYLPICGVCVWFCI